jgi:hypothetical protein
VLDSVLPSIAKFWHGCPYPIYVGLNSQAVLLPGFVPVVAPASEWFRETLLQLEQIAAEHLIVILDDFLFGAPVNQARMAELVELAARRHLAYLRLVPLGRSLAERFARLFHSPCEEEIGAVRATHPFYSALQIAIWRKDHLMAMLRKGCSIWQFEREVLPGSVHCAIFDRPPVEYRHVVEKGRWLPQARLLFRRADLQFRAGERPVWSRWSYLRLAVDRLRWLVLGYSTC